MTVLSHISEHINENCYIYDYQEGPIPYIGEFFSALTAIVWAFAVILLKKSGDSVHPIALNLFKNSSAFILFIITSLVLNQSLFYPAPLEDYLLVFVSGVLGIGIADTFFLVSLNLLGAGLSAIVACLYSPFIIGLSIMWLGDSLSWVQIIGICLIISSILFISGIKTQGKTNTKRLWMGIGWGVLAEATIAIGIVMIKPLLNQSPLLWVTEVRLFGGVVILFIVLQFLPNRKTIINSLFHLKSWKFTISGSFFGAYAAMILWLAGMKFTQTSTAAALNQTSNIFIFIFAALFLKEKITATRVAAIVLAVVGAILVTFS